jgi:hypothetical protein
MPLKLLLLASALTLTDAGGLNKKGLSYSLRR